MYHSDREIKVEVNCLRNWNFLSPGLPFFSCNVENLGMGLGQGYVTHTLYSSQKGHLHEVMY